MDVINNNNGILQDLYKQGARSFWIHNTGPIGCLPVTLRDHTRSSKKPGKFDHHGCVKAQNDMAKQFNRLLKHKVNKLREKLPLAALTYVDMYTAKYKLISNANKQGKKKKKS